MKHFYSVFFFLIATVPAAISQDVQKCCGNNNNTFLLGNTNYALHSQCLYLPSDLTGAATGMIERIYYRYGSTGEETGNTLGDLRISLKQVTETGFTNMYFFTDLVTVLESASYTIPPGVTGDWFAIELDQPFPYDPTLTLVVDIVFATSTTVVFGTLSTSMPGRKIYSNDPQSPTGGAVVSNWQDIGFDLDLTTTIGTQSDQQNTFVSTLVNDQLRITFDAPLTTFSRIEIMDLSGKTLLRTSAAAGSETFLLNTSALPAGAYILRSISTNGESESHKFIRE